MSVNKNSKGEKKKPLIGNSILDFERDYTVVDIETTGVNFQESSILEVGAVKISNGIMKEKFSELIRPQKFFLCPTEFDDDFCFVNGEKVQYINDFVRDLTGIKNKMLENARSESEVLEDFFYFIGNDLIIGHNVAFDLKFLSEASVKNFQKPILNSYSDTLKISVKLFPNMEHHKLKDLAELYNIDYSHAHRALEDCIITFKCYEYMKKQILESFGTYKKFENYYRTKTKKKKNIQSLAGQQVIINI
ncbi:3'-5' exonuclease [bacterium]|nr:3'-5' exonuclease [bacterium]